MLLRTPGGGARHSAESPQLHPEYSPEGVRTTARSALDVIRESLFGDVYSPEAQARWTPLPLGTFFTEGWDQPYVVPTSGSGGAPRQGWVSAFGGNFYRAWFFAFAYAQDVGHNGNQYLGQYEIFVPLNRRFEFEVRYNFILSNKGGSSNTYHGNTGDTGFIGRFQLSESKDFGQTFHFGGLRAHGQPGTTAPVWPASSRITSSGGTSTATGPCEARRASRCPPTRAGAHTQYHNLLALGRYFQGSDDSWFQQWWLYLVATENATIAGSPRRENYFSLLPGMRCKIPAVTAGTGLWYFFASVEVPMSRPAAVHLPAAFSRCCMTTDAGPGRARRGCPSRRSRCHRRAATCWYRVRARTSAEPGCECRRRVR